MPREKEDYRANLERLNELYPDHLAKILIDRRVVA